MGNLMKIKSIRKFLNRNACENVITGLCLSHLDYFNAILNGLLDCSIKKLQRIQNIAAKLVLNKGKYDSVTESMKELHWLPVEARIRYKLLTLVHKSIHGNVPQYLQILLTIVPVRRTLRSSSSSNLLVIPRTKSKTFAPRSFSVSGPVYWNAMPEYPRATETYDIFKSQLKTYLFKLFYC